MVMTRPILREETARLLRVVLADADADTRLLYREALRSMPFDIVEATDGRDALVRCLIEPPALLITETQLPGIDGYHLCQLLRRDPLTRSIPILVVTSEVRPVQIARVRQMGAGLVLAKPVEMDTLAEAVTRLCEGPVDASPIEPAPDGATLEASRAASRSFRRFETTTPQRRPPALRCTRCDGELEYRKSRVGGVTQRYAEQWDEFECPVCSRAFEYRHRTRKLRLLMP
ncbi:MAG: response receiver sensor diguanylate cyclase/phosphodiesterase [Acidobacteria bacterium]|nr:response receiver sensor diguanylate cyclase/phosphodiesterase [Acidobacteriota bacterium]